MVAIIFMVAFKLNVFANAGYHEFSNYDIKIIHNDRLVFNEWGSDDLSYLYLLISKDINKSVLKYKMDCEINLIKDAINEFENKYILSDSNVFIYHPYCTGAINELYGALEHRQQILDSINSNNVFGNIRFDCSKFSDGMLNKNIKFMINGILSNEDTENMFSYTLNLLNSNLLKKKSIEGLRIYISPYKLKKDRMGINGYSTQDKCIVLSSYSPSTLLHELGHVVFYKIYKQDAWNDYLNLYPYYKKNNTKTYELWKMDIRENAAEDFKMYMINNILFDKENSIKQKVYLKRFDAEKKNTNYEFNSKKIKIFMDKLYK